MCVCLPVRASSTCVPAVCVRACVRALPCRAPCARGSTVLRMRAPPWVPVCRVHPPAGTCEGPFRALAWLPAHWVHMGTCLVGCWSRERTQVAWSFKGESLSCQRKDSFSGDGGAPSTSSGATPPSTRAAQPSAGARAAAQDPSEQLKKAEDYLQKHQIRSKVEAAVNQVLTSMPANAIDALAEALKSVCVCVCMCLCVFSCGCVFFLSMCIAGIERVCARASV